MEANKKIGADDYKFVAAQYPNESTVKKIGTWVFAVLAAALVFVAMLVFLKQCLATCGRH
jgi:hypothetical protein